jgi:16S rRNA (guanine966-N2)-methyltransferase
VPTVRAGTVSRVTRIVAGTLGGRRLAAPAGSRTRPTSDRVREGLFNTLQSLVDLAGARFADLYAGSGAVGLEAYSRGAAEVLLVESQPAAARVARANVATLRAAPAVRLVTAEVSTMLAASAGAEPGYDVVFADPPYAMPDQELVALQRALLDGGWLAPGAIVVIERATRSAAVRWVEPLTEVRTRRYGETTLWYGQRS